MTDAGFYRAFEDRYRGSRELIANRLRVYLPFIEGLKAALPDGRGVDLGCGRGEWLELLASEGFECRGIDLDEGMLAACHELGLPAERADAMEWLRAQPEASLALVSAFHVAEHLPFEILQAVVAEARRVLAPGGLLILETPNPENLAVGTESFYLDPTHVRPLPPALLAFLPEFHGFARTRVLRLQHDPALMSAPWLGVRDVLEGISPDYAVIAQAPGSEAAGEALDAAFALDDGISRAALAGRHDRLVNERFDRVETLLNDRAQPLLAGRIESVEAQLAEAHVQLVEARAQLVEGAERAAALAQRVEALEQAMQACAALAESLGQELAAVYGSSSWRATEPLRRLGKLVRRLGGSR
jgi:O-antigen chain-terminating methyltransferase